MKPERLVMCTALILIACRDVQGDLWIREQPPDRCMDGVILQTGTHDCGAACAAMVLRTLGCPASLQELSSELDMKPDGSSLLSLKRAIERRGFRAQGLRIMPDLLHTIPTPAILFVGRRHFVVFDSMQSGGKYALRDPATGKRNLSKEGLAKIWNGEILIVGTHAMIGAKKDVNSASGQ